MWKAFSLRTRLAVLLCAMLLVVLIVSALLLRAFSLNQIVEENEPGARSAQLVALGLNEVLRVSPDPRRALDAFAAGLNTSGREGLRFESRSVDAREAHRIQTPQSPFVPDWFVSIVGFPKIGEHIPVFIASERVGDIVYEPDVSADIYEKWMGFLALALAAVGLAGITLAGAYFLLGRTVRSLDVLSNGLTRLRAGDYSTPIVPFGPPEIRRSSEEANALALTLAQLKTDNRNLLRRMISMQDDERGYIARELHDELGPLLFGVRANAVAFLESTTSHDRSPAAPQLANKIMECAESLQQASRRILDRLRPLHIDELGLQESIQALLRDAAANAPELKISSKIDSNLPSESVASQTIYRVIQEGVTNVLKHARAGQMDVRAFTKGNQVFVEILDDGVGFAPDMTFGRGLTGMQERVRGLGGTIRVERKGQQTVVRCLFPADIIH